VLILASIFIDVNLNIRYGLFGSRPHLQ